MNTFKQWYVRNQDEITWFIMGWLSLSCVDNLSNRHYVMALADAVIVYANYKLAGVRLK
jgi:hypothetical protein